MTRIAKPLFGIALAAAAMAASAQATTTDDARAIAAREHAEAAYRDTFVKPQLDAVAPGDYRADAHNRALQSEYVAHAAAVRAYGAGERSQPTVALFEDQVRDEAARVRAEQALARDDALLQSSAQARADLERGLRETTQVAAR